VESLNPVFILVGPPAVGKSTTSKALAAKFNRSIHIPVDDIRDMVVSGLTLPGIEWSAELVQQIRLARESAVQMALNYQNAGFAVVIDDFIDPNQLVEYRELLDKTDIHKFVLYPHQETAHARNLQRAGADPARSYIDDGIRIVYQQLNTLINPLRIDGWIVLDTTELSIEQTVSEIQKYSSF
jgi:adenylate kinase family enzyme